LLLLAIGEQAGGWRVTAREFDVATRSLGQLHSRDVWHESQLPAELFRVAVSAFRPLARIDGVQGQAVQLQARGAAGVTRRRRSGRV
jgi:hypothetical protein